MHVKQVDVSGIKYNVVEASAIQQKSLLMLVGGRLALNSASSGVEEISIPMVKGMLMTLPESEFDKIATIVMHKTVKDGGDKLISIDDFQNKINDYFTLIAESVKVNLQDFFTWLDTENAETRQNQAGGK